MKRWQRSFCALGLAGCAAPAPAQVALRPAQAAPAEAVVFCAGTVTEHEVHRCVWQLTSEQQRHRSYSQRLLLRRGEFSRLDTVSGSGAPQELSSVYEYRGGRVRSWSRENRNGVVRGRNVLADDERWVRWLDEQDRPRVRAKTTISGLRRVLSARGRVESFSSVNWLGQPAAEGAVHETRVLRSAAGAVLERRFFGLRGEPVQNEDGSHRITFEVDERGVERERRYFDAAGAPALASGVHLVRTRSNRFGEPEAVAYLDVQGAPARETRDGAAGLRYERDERGNELSLTLLDEQGRPLVGSNGWAMRKRRYDELDAVIETAFFDASGSPVRERERGAALVREPRGERGNVTSELFYDERGEPALGTQGYHRADIEYDQRDNPVSYVYSDVKDVPLRSRRLYYDGDRLIREEHTDAAGKPLLTAQGYASYEISYLEDGSEGMKRYFDASGGQQVTCHGAAPQALQSELAERAGSLRSCYERLLRYGSTEEGKLMVELSVDGRGAVLNAALVQDEIDDGDLTKCVLETMRVPYLNKSEGDCATVRVPVVFRQKR
ncbi:MAG: AgmX/PglI C-terminal domain-containing protein [Myxococcales bacterium]|nr:MAG: AgmX/PglI C-terminal domain-containing protein [Myxococcales bacterium]